MESIMTIVAWGMITSIGIGAIGGWIVFIVAWLDELRANGRFQIVKAPRTPRRQRQAAET